MIVLIGLDGTICDSRWRLPFIETDGWDAYHEQLVLDKPNEAVQNLVRTLSESSTSVIVGLTSRPERWRNVTVRWLLDNDVPLDDLLMRHDNDFRPAAEMKTEIASVYLEKSDFVWLIDDRDDVIAAFRAIGVCCLQFSRL